MTSLCNLRFISFNHEIIISLNNLIKKLILFTFTFKTTGFISLPVKKTRLTMIRSPHVYKKSQESFEFFYFKKFILMQIQSLSALSIFFKYFKLSYFNNLETRFKNFLIYNL